MLPRTCWQEVGYYWLRVRCAFTSHTWSVDSAVDAGRGWCSRCGLNDHVWLPLPPLMPSDGA